MSDVPKNKAKTIYSKESSPMGGKFFLNITDIARGLRSSPLVNEDVDKHHDKSHLRI